MPPLVSVSLAFLLGIALSGAGGGTWPVELKPREVKSLRMNTCCMDSGRPCPRGNDRG